ncbi:MAG: HPr family phosphocarrier protein [Pseudoflavonifractor sp.]
MQTFSVTLSSVTQVKTFVDAATRCESEIDVHSGRYLIDAKSIMGIFSLDLAKPIGVTFHGSDAEAALFRQEIAAFLCE